jgi:hypothetical protein
MAASSVSRNGLVARPNFQATKKQATATNSLHTAFAGTTMVVFTRGRASHKSAQRWMPMSRLCLREHARIPVRVRDVTDRWGQIHHKWQEMCLRHFGMP